MASKSKGGKFVETMNARTIEKRFKFKTGEEIIDMRISLGIVPVGGRGPRPKMDLVLTAAFMPPAEKGPKLKRIALAPMAKATPLKGKSAKMKKKPGLVKPDKPLTPVGGQGRKPRVNP